MTSQNTVKIKVFNQFFCLIEGSPHHLPQTRSKNDGSGYKALRSPRISSKESIPPAYVAYSVGLAPIDCLKLLHRARICKPKKPRNQLPVWRTGPPGYIGWWNRFLGFLNAYKFNLRVRICKCLRSPGIDSWAPLTFKIPEPVFVDLLRRPGIDFQPGGPVRQPYFSYRSARLHRLAKSIPRNRFLSSINVYKYGLSSDKLAESIPGP